MIAYKTTMPYKERVMVLVSKEARAFRNVDSTESRIVQRVPKVSTDLRIQPLYGKSFRMVESIGEVAEDGTMIAYHPEYTGDEILRFSDHFLNNPILAGMVQVEMMAQAAAELIAKRIDTDNFQPLFKGIRSVSFLRKVIPGTRLMTMVDIIEFEQKKFKGSTRGVAKCTLYRRHDEMVVAETTFEFASIPKRK